MGNLQKIWSSRIQPNSEWGVRNSVRIRRKRRISVNSGIKFDLDKKCRQWSF